MPRKLTIVEEHAGPLGQMPTYVLAVPKPGKSADRIKVKTITIEQLITTATEAGSDLYIKREVLLALQGIPRAAEEDEQDELPL